MRDREKSFSDVYNPSMIFYMLDSYMLEAAHGDAAMARKGREKTDWKTNIKSTTENHVLTLSSEDIARKANFNGATVDFRAGSTILSNGERGGGYDGSSNTSKAADGFDVAAENSANVVSFTAPSASSSSFCFEGRLVRQKKRKVMKQQQQHAQYYSALSIRTIAAKTSSDSDTTFTLQTICVFHDSLTSNDSSTAAASTPDIYGTTLFCDCILRIHGYTTTSTLFGDAQCSRDIGTSIQLLQCAPYPDAIHNVFTTYTKNHIRNAATHGDEMKHMLSLFHYNSNETVVEKKKQEDVSNSTANDESVANHEQFVSLSDCCSTLVALFRSTDSSTNQRKKRVYVKYIIQHVILQTANVLYQYLLSSTSSSTDIVLLEQMLTNSSDTTASTTIQSSTHQITSKKKSTKAFVSKTTLQLLQQLEFKMSAKHQHNIVVLKPIVLSPVLDTSDVIEYMKNMATTATSNTNQKESRVDKKQKNVMDQQQHTTDDHNSNTSCDCSSSHTNDYMTQKKYPQIQYILQSMSNAVAAQSRATASESSSPTSAQSPESSSSCHTPPFRHVLDVGGGCGDLGCAIALQYPTTHVTIIDMNKAVIESGRQYMNQMMGNTDRIHFITANFMEYMKHPYSYYSITDDEGNSTMNDEIPKIDYIVGLHTCGELTDVMFDFILQRRHESGSISFCICPCCYAKRIITTAPKHSILSPVQEKPSNANIPDATPDEEKHLYCKEIKNKVVISADLNATKTRMNNNTRLRSTNTHNRCYIPSYQLNKSNWIIDDDDECSGMKKMNHGSSRAAINSAICNVPTTDTDCTISIDDAKSPTVASSVTTAEVVATTNINGNEITKTIQQQHRILAKLAETDYTPIHSKRARMIINILRLHSLQQRQQLNTDVWIEEFPSKYTLRNLILRGCIMLEQQF